MRLTKLIFTTSALAGGFIAAAGVAQAATAEYHVIVLDQTGSMHVPGHDNVPLLNGQPNITTEVFDNALNAAINWVTTDKGTLGSVGGQRAYAIFTFKDDNCCGGTQSGLKQIWPKAGSKVGCDPAVDLSRVDATGFCLFDANQPDPYDSLMGVLDSLRATKNDPNGLLSPITMGTGGATFDPQYGLGPNTPLANSFCDAAERLVLAKGLSNPVFTLETDGGENYSLAQAFHACGGADAGFVDAAATSFVKTKSDWGLTAGGWKSNVMRRVTRFNQPGKYKAPVSGGLSTNDAQDQSIIAAGPIATPPDDVLVGSKWRIDVHFAICDSSLSSPPPCPGVTASAMTASLQSTTTAAPTTTLVAATPKTSRSSRDGFTFSPVTSKAAIATTTPATSLPGKPLLATAAATSTSSVTTLAAATTSTKTQSISANELAFFKAVGKVNSKSTFRQFVRDQSTASPVHVPKIAGDVDDSGCTDGADFRIVTQADVYYQPAVLPNQLAIRADLNGDQWVNKLDAQIVLANWGKGCINNPGPKPVLKY